MDQCDVAVIGAGPAGCTAAGYLARLGYRTVLFDRACFPRHRVGESLLPSMMPVLEDFGLVDACRRAGFVEKRGATFIWGKSREPWDISFSETPFLPAAFAFHVERSVFDQILLDHARRVGTQVHLNTTVIDILREGHRVVGLTYRENDRGHTGMLQARFIVDASGSSSVLGKRVTKRRYDEHMRQIALFAYWKNIRGIEGFRRNNIIVESVPKGWFWFIPMNSARLGEVSLGLVTGREFQSQIQQEGVEAFYERALAEAPFVKDLVGPHAVRLNGMHGVRDWAYTCDDTAGPGYYLAGDAAAFLDPLLSTGVSLAMLAAYSTSVCIHSVLKDPGMEQAAAQFYAGNYRLMYEVTRDFLHYFYAGNASSHPNDLFWEARRMLRLDQNIGVKQAFSFFINTIPGNPHPALQKQVPLFKQFMVNLGHLANESAVACGGGKFINGHYRPANSLSEGDTPVVNGSLESTWRIDKERHRLEPIHGIAFDKERPVFSSTSSWLLGRNIAALDNGAFAVLRMMDGQRTWSAIVAAYCAEHGLSLEQGRAQALATISPLLAQNFVLVKDGEQHPAVIGKEEK